MLMPFGARVIVAPHDPDVQKLKSGLYVAKDQDIRPVTGHVVAVGPGPWKMKEPPEVGQAIVFGRMRGAIHRYLGKEYLIITEEYIYAHYPSEEIPVDLN